MKKILLLTIFALFGLITTVHSQQCGGTFTDPAGLTANYANASDYTVTILPTNVGEVVTVDFTAFDTEVNFDALYVFNGNSITAPQIASTNGAANVPGGLTGGYWGTALPGPFTSTAIDGSLTFRFRSDGSINRAGWIANVTCLPPPTCIGPTSLFLPSTATHNSVTLTWSQSGAISSWECIAVPAGSAAPTAGTTGYQTATSYPFIITGLTASTCYDLYVRAVCSPTDKSYWSALRGICTALAPAEPPVCGGNFVDAGGSAATYPANSNSITTICPVNPGDVVTVTFTAFNTEANFDPLYVFDGNSTSAPQIASTNGAPNLPNPLAGGYWGTAIPGPFTSTAVNGCLTFWFRSDGSVQNPGWISNITCSPPPTCPSPSALLVNSITPNSATLNWSSTAATNWEVLVLPAGSPAPTGVGIPVTSNSFIATGLTSATCYVFYVRAICSPTDRSNWVGGFNFCTLIAPPACGGQFVDNGGPNATYANNSNNTYTICPTNPNEIVTVVFNTFDTEANWDALYVFDGNSMNAPQITSTNLAGNVPGGRAGGFWGTTIPGPFTSSSLDGCLTFNFRSDNSGIRAGWIANVICNPTPDRIVLVAYIDENSNGVFDSGESLFPSGKFVYQQNDSGTDIFGYSPTGQFPLYDTNSANSYDFAYELLPLYAPYYDSGTTTFTNISIPVGSGTQFLYFPIISTTRYSDIAITISPMSPPRPGLTYVNRITYKNTGTAVGDGTITFAKPAQITTFTTTQAGVINNVSGFTYNYTGLQPNETRSFNVTMTVPANLPVNTLLTDTALITANDDFDLTNNSSSNTQIVVASYDPNDKMESRGKTIPFNQFAQDDYFIYTIRFQNTGTANAIDVRIEDILDGQIDPTSILMVNASHNYTLKRTGTQLVWEFKNIFLPPSSLNETGSIGFVQFKVRLNPGFQAGDIIPNGASIYFDTNPPILTNIFSSKFIVPLDVSTFDTNSLVLYPNPATNTVQIDLINTSEELSKVVFYDILGKSVKTVSTVAADNVSVDVSDLSKGVYLVEITSDTNLTVTRKLIIQ